MARPGVTQEDVDAAADRLLEAGERPTIERVRAALGTGSPNTLIRLLDVWWAGLGRRLQAQAAKIALPEAPASVADLASKLWEYALDAAADHAQQALLPEREQLACEREALAGERETLKSQTEAITAQMEAAQHSEQVAQSRLTETTRLVDQQAMQLRDLGQQRDTAQQRADRLELELIESRTRLDDQQASIALERDRQAKYVEALENRSSVEIDRARQEARTLRSDLAAAQQDHARGLKFAHKQRDEAVDALAEAQRTVATHRAQIDVLERRHSEFATLAASVQSVLRQVKAQQPNSPNARRTPKRKASKEVKDMTR